MKTITEVRENFWDSHPKFKSEYRKTYRQKDYKTDIRVAFCDYVENLSHNGIISGKLTQRVTL